MYKPIIQRIRDYVQVMPNHCWEWTGARNSYGYGSITLKHDHKARAHRVVYKLLVDPSITGEHVHHTCENIICINPSHLVGAHPGIHSLLTRRLSGISTRQTRVKPKKDKADRKPRQPRTHCLAGHEFTVETTKTMNYRGKPERTCRVCVRNRSRRYYQQSAPV
jgi:hypothetical protein